ncbi:MAG: aminodeoxychorismate/anthranilate synthase component II [Devosiaceae bacterium]|nr:aminodeoxychorismate/anthranilate synthase component II [Devosiaceae bacterium]
MGKSLDTLVIDNYDSFTYNLVHYLGDLGAKTQVVRNDKISLEEIDTLAPEAIILSPGPCTPSEAGICVDLVGRFSGKIPIFGVCLGLQSIAQAFGGIVDASPTLMHGKISPISHTGKGVFEAIKSPFDATRYHSLCVLKQGLPDCLEITAQTADGVIMGLSHVSDPTHGVQFHPESIASEHGHDILRNFLKLAQEFSISKSI